MTARIILITDDGKSALIDLRTKQQVNQSALPESERIKTLTLDEAVKILRPFLEDLLAT
jgi:hypothetical protein